MRCLDSLAVSHADDGVRKERLAKRGQPELATAEMASWASYLQESAQQLGGVVVDASPAIEQVVDAICVHALPLLEPQDEAPRDPRDRMRAKRSTRPDN